MKTTTKILSTLITLSLGACAIDQVDDGTDDDYTNEGRLAANGLTPTQLWSLGAINPRALTGPVADQFASTAEGKAVLPYLVTCALDPTQSITYHTPTTVTATGSLGLATTWTSSTLTVTQQELVTSCILSLLNENGVSVTVSLRGDEQGYAKQGNEATYQKQEGAWFGNVFSATAYSAFSCRGTDTPVSTRLCSLSGHCGMTWVGTCASNCSFTDDHASSCTVNGVTYDNVTTAWDAGSPL